MNKNSNSSATESRKQKASSPLENENAKKLCENLPLNISQQPPQEPMDSETMSVQQPVLQQLASVLTQESNSQHVSHVTIPPLGM